jgi:hypothetical protein
MYKLADIDFSSRLGVLVSEMQPNDIDLQDQALNAEQGASLLHLATASSPSTNLDMAVFSAP